MFVRDSRPLFQADGTFVTTYSITCPRLVAFELMALLAGTCIARRPTRRASTLPS